MALLTSESSAVRAWVDTHGGTPRAHVVSSVVAGKNALHIKGWRLLPYSVVVHITVHIVHNTAVAVSTHCFTGMRLYAKGLLREMNLNEQTYINVSDLY